MDAGWRARAVVAAAATILAAALAVAPARAQSDGIDIHGSNTVGAALMPGLIEAYADAIGLQIERAEDPDDPESERITGFFGIDRVLDVALERRGSSTGFAGLLVGDADIGMSSRPIRGAEAEALADRYGEDLTAAASQHVVALDGIAIIVSPDVTVQGLSVEDVARIFAGEIENWSAFGLPSLPITLHARDDQSGTYDTFESLVLDRFERALSPTAARYVANADLVADVRAGSGAIGFTPLAFLDNVRALPLELECGLLIAPNDFTVKAEEYPLGRRLFLYTPGAPDDPNARALVEFATSDQAQDVVDTVGFVSQSVAEQDEAARAEHLIAAIMAAGDETERSAARRFISLARNATRLSPTFRFQEGGTLLDGKSLLDAGRLARWLERPENADRRVVLMGFADDSGAFDVNLALTVARAEAVRRNLLVQVSAGFDAARIEVAGFGSAAPVACNNSEAGRARNRRVEVWVLD